MVIRVKRKKSIMKKTYSKPTLEVVKMQTQQMLALSTNGSTDLTSGNLAPEYDGYWDE